MKTERRLSGRRHLALGGVLLAALLMRGLYLWGQAQNNPLFDDPYMDGRVHHEWASQIAAGQGLGTRPYFRAPLYYYLLGGLYKLTGPSVAAGRLAGCVLGAVTCYLIARLGAALAGFGAGLLAGLLASVYWPFVYFDGELLTVGLETFLNTALLLTLLSATRRDRLPLFLLAGLIWGLSAITRPNVLAVAPGILLWLWLALARPARFGRWLAAVALLGAGTAAAVLPVTLRNWLVGGEFVLIATNGGVNFYIGNNPQSNGFVAVVPGTRPGWWEGYEDTHRIVEQTLGRKPTESEVSRYWYKRAWEWIRSDPRAWLELLLLKARLFFTPMEIPNNQPIWFFARMSGISQVFWIGFPAVACLGVAGFVLHGLRRPGWLLLLVFGLLYACSVIAFFCPARYRIPVIPVLIVSAAAGLVALPQLAAARRLGPLAAYAASAAAIAATMPFNLPKEYDAFAAYDEAEGHRMLGGHFARVEPASADSLYRAAEHFRTALSFEPDHVQTRLLLADVLSRCPGGDAEAIQVLEPAARRKPVSQAVHLALARALHRQRRFEEAVSHFRQAARLARLTPRDSHTYAQALRATGRYAGAIEVLRGGLADAPRDVALLTALAWLRATAPQDNLRDGAEAVRLAEQARALADPTEVPVLDALAAAYAEVGHFDDAVRCATQAMELARRAARAALADEIAARVELYRQERPYREPPPPGVRP